MPPKAAPEREYFVVVSTQDDRATPCDTATPTRGGRSSTHSKPPALHSGSTGSSHETTRTPIKPRTPSVFRSPQATSRSPAKTKRKYPRMMCLFCLDASKNHLLEKVDIIEGRAHILRRHLARCKFASSYRDNSGGIWEAPSWERGVVQKMRKRAVELMADAKLPASFFDRKSFKRFVEAVCPSAVRHLPNRKYMSGKGLDDASEESDEISKCNLEAKQRELKVPVSLLSDGWTNVAKGNVLGCQLTLPGCIHTLELLDVGTRHDGIAVAQQLEGVIKSVAKEFKERAKSSKFRANVTAARDEVEPSGLDSDDDQVAIDDGVVQVGGCVTDDAGQCGRARRILSLRYPHIIFLRCFAHDINNLVKQVLRTEFSEIARQVSAAVNYLNASSSTLLVHAKASMMRRYKETRGFDRLARSKHWHLSSRTLFRRSWLSSRVNPAGAERIIAPLAEASYRLQRNDSTLADVVVSLRDIYYAFATNLKYGHSLVHCVENRWAKCEQPLFVAAFCLHPSLRDDIRRLFEFNPELELLVSDAVVYYYRRFYGEDVGNIRDELSAWLSLDNLQVRLSDFKHPGPSYWKLVRGKYPKLARLCVRILSVPVHTANVERLFSELGAIHTAIRNRLEADKARKLHSIGKRVREEDGDICVKKRRLKIRSPTELEVKVDTPPNAIQDEDEDDAHDPEEASLACVIDSFKFMQTALETIFQDDDIAEEFALEQVEQGYDPYEKIPEPNRKPWPTFNDLSFHQEQKLTGFRSWSITLAKLFPLQLHARESQVTEE